MGSRMTREVVRTVYRREVDALDQIDGGLRSIAWLYGQVFAKDVGDGRWKVLLFESLMTSVGHYEFQRI